MKLFSHLLPIKTAQFRFLPVKQQQHIQPQGLHLIVLKKNKKSRQFLAQL